jgi:outer membrane protein insertion porin family/translocation and assembly module TamA
MGGLLLVGLPSVGWAQRPARCNGNERIRAVEFSGSPSFDALTMATSIVTHEPGLATRWLGLGTAPCVDTLEVRRDALRLAILHRQIGWFRASVTPLILRARNGVRVRFTIIAGPEALLDTVRVTGLPEAPVGRRPFGAPVHALQGKRFDRTRLDTTVASVITHLRDAGYARARVTDTRIAIDTTAARAVLDLTVEAGRIMTVGAVQIAVQAITPSRPRVDSADVARLLDIHMGDRFGANRILEAQQTLYRSEAFRLVLVDTLTPASPSRDSVLDLRVAVAEARTRNARVGLGWATLDCVRAQGRITDRGFLGVGKRLELSVRMSKLGVGKPADLAPALCSQSVRDDPYSARVNYYVGTTYTTPRLFGTGLVPLLSVYSERRSEPFAYLRESAIGVLAEVSQRFTRRTSGTAGLQYENGKTTTDFVVSCTRFNLCRPEELVLSQFGRGIGILSTSVTHDHTDDPTAPARGWRSRLEGRVGETSSELISTLRFYRATGEIAGYRRVLGGIVGARVQSAGVFAPGASLVDGTPLIPQQERLFVGGQNSVRGYQQNLLGPVIYVVSNVEAVTNPDGSTGFAAKAGAGFDRAVPRGGTAMLVGNLEWRRGFRFIAEQVQFAAFLDAGTVWESQGPSVQWGDLRATPGIGVRVITPLGPFRIDVGYRPYAALAGRALYFAPSGSEGDQIYCASPRVDGATGDFTDVLSCPATYRPPASRSPLSRLVFHFGLGQAF